MNKTSTVVVNQSDLALILACITSEQRKWATGVDEAYLRLIGPKIVMATGRDIEATRS